MTIVIMQPTYLPWLGYFDLIAQSDTFIFLDNVQFERQSWQQRNRIKTAGGPQWLTVPIQHAFGQTIQEVRIAADPSWRRRHYNSFVANYGRAPFWQKYSGAIRDAYETEWTNLIDLNIHMITTLSALFGIPLKPVRASSLGPVEGRKGTALVEMCRRLGGDTYLSPLGALEYLRDDTAFEEAGIKLVFQNYEHPVYSQLHGAFIPFLCAADLLLNAGDNSGRTIADGRRASRSLAELASFSASGDNWV